MQHLKGSKVWADYQEAKLPGLRTSTSSCETEAKPSKVCVAFIEPRCHPTSEFVLRNFRAALPDVPIVIVHGTKNEEYMRTIAKGIRGVFQFINSNEANLPPPAYNKLLTRAEFWKQFDYEWVLTAQTDTVLLQPASGAIKELMESGIKYIGAPWSYVCNVCQNPLTGGCGHMIDQAIVASIPSMVGNGGLSFRHIPTMLKALELYSMNIEVGKVHSKATNEDVFYAQAFTLMGETMPLREEALKFCVEQVLPLQWAPPLGMHKPWVYLPPGIVKGLLDMSTL